LWDAGAITARVLIVRGERDSWSRPEDVAWMEGNLTNAASMRTVTLPHATHFVHLDRPERGREHLIDEVTALLGS
jgi:pimeloyl-ACP methyl ester carboxylesterase